MNTWLDINNENDGLTTLREAVRDTLNGGTVNFAANLDGKTITLDRRELEGYGQISFSKSLTIDASMLSSLTIDGNDPDRNDPVPVPGNGIRIFNITAPNLNSVPLVTMKNLTLTGGDVFSENGGAIRASASLTLENCTISNNYASSNGGGLYFSGGSGSALTLKSTSVDHNTCGDKGGCARIPPKQPSRLRTRRSEALATKRSPEPHCI